ncbi:hypothetical protein ACQPZX_31610 [Actinoplanes sp. CA-142083]|uniref:hypothetical protein n=1 Tax=Actinoplanes sp. CA-142083 TaxID=3239903 RepID=UPI003D8F1956
MTPSRTSAAAMLAFTALALTACGDDVSSSAAGSAPADVCPAIEKLDPAAVLGGPAANHRACAPDESLATLGAAVWTASGGQRVSVSVIDNGKPGAATFQQLYDQASSAQRCELAESGGGDRRCVDKLSTGQTETGTFIIDLGSTYLVVWLSDEGDHSAGLDVPADMRPAFMTFAGQAVSTIYGKKVEMPAAPPERAAPTTAGDLAAQLTQAGYERTMTGSYQSPDLGRKVSIEDWKDDGKPTVALSDSRTKPGDLAIAELQYDPVGKYQKFSCIPTTKFASDLQWVLDQSNTIQQQVADGTVEPKLAPNNRHMVDNADRSLTCYME